MPIYVVYLAAYLLAGCLVTIAMLAAGFLWGAFAGLRARAERSPKWRAYFLVLLPPAALALAFLSDVCLAKLAPSVFLALAAPAFVGACLRYNRPNVHISA